jgi:hypothetical protein
MVIVKNNSVSIRFIPTGGKDSRPGVDGIRLMPGNNEVPSTAWEQAKKIAVIRMLLEDETLEEGESTPDGEEAEAADGTPVILGMNEKKAKKLVAETFDVELLKSWLVAEKRPKVKAAIDAQLEELKPDTKDEAKEETNADGEEAEAG